MPIIVVPYDPRWPLAFQAMAQVYARALEGVAIAIEHVVSTSVPGLAAKPILDIDIVIPSRAALPETIVRLAALGYRHQGDLGISDREAFVARDEDSYRPCEDGGGPWPEHHLYVCPATSRELHRHLGFRDWLRSHPGVAAEYARLKKKLAAIHGDDRDAYTRAKTNFIERELFAQSGATGQVPAR